MSGNVSGAADIMDTLPQREEGALSVEPQCSVVGVATGNVSEPDCEAFAALCEDTVASNDTE